MTPTAMTGLFPLLAARPATRLRRRRRGFLRRCRDGFHIRGRDDGRRRDTLRGGRRRPLPFRLAIKQLPDQLQDLGPGGIQLTAQREILLAETAHFSQERIMVPWQIAQRGPQGCDVGGRAGTLRRGRRGECLLAMKLWWTKLSVHAGY